MKQIILGVFLLPAIFVVQGQQCRFELSGGKETATYFEAINWYKKLDEQSAKVLVKPMGATDAGYPLHLVMVSSDGKFDAVKWHQQRKAVILINNGIHPGEPDGIDASMLLVRDIVKGKLNLPANVVMAIIPVYNIGGCINRGTSLRANQDGPLQYGFRGNAQNLDLNRDFTKCDSRNARAFATIFQELDPDILIDNHVSDGADYQHTFTLLTTQYDKLDATMGKWLKETFEPSLYRGMAQKKWDICPYVNFETEATDNGMQMFYDPPRYSSGYAALFQTIGFVPETHMLKPFDQRVQSTYAFMQTVIEQSALQVLNLKMMRAAARMAAMEQKQVPLGWEVDSATYSYTHFNGYQQAFKTSEITGMQRMYYDRTKPYSRQVKYYNVFKPTVTVSKARAYILPQGWWAVAEVLKINGVFIKQLAADTLITVEAYRVDNYKSFTRPYEKHHKNYAVKVSASKQTIQFYKGDFYIPLSQARVRYITEMLEPTGDDSFFAWNYFDAVLQQKEGYSDYRWEDIAADVLKNNPQLQQQLQQKKLSDSAFAADAGAQLDFIYKHSAYYEPAHLRYPVYRIVQ
jgi:hypothetical protein